MRSGLLFSALSCSPCSRSQLYKINTLSLPLLPTHKPEIHPPIQQSHEPHNPCSTPVNSQSRYILLHSSHLTTTYALFLSSHLASHTYPAPLQPVDKSHTASPLQPTRKQRTSFPTPIISSHNDDCITSGKYRGVDNRQQSAYTGEHFKFRSVP